MNTLLEKLRECIQAEIALAIDFVSLRPDEDEIWQKRRLDVERKWQEFAQLLAKNEADSG